jgi:hypothetical protein
MAVEAICKGRHSDGREYRARRADRRAHGWRRLPRPERGHPSDRAQGDRRSRRRDRWLPRWLAGTARGNPRGADHRVDARHPAARRNDPALVTYESLQAGRRA